MQDTTAITQDLEQKRDIGRVGSGNMRIDEFAKTMDDRLPYDVVDDVCIYMRNDPIFYRKSLFPAIMKMKDIYDAGKTPNESSCLEAACAEGMKSYCKKFKLGSPENVFTISAIFSTSKTFPLEAPITMLPA